MNNDEFIVWVSNMNGTSFWDLIKVWIVSVSLELIDNKSSWGLGVFVHVTWINPS